MREFGKFLIRFSGKLWRLTGVPALAGSRPVQFIWHSSALTFTRSWFIPTMLFLLLAVAVFYKGSFFEQSRQQVAFNYYDAAAHLSLAQAAAEENDYVLAQNEYNLAAGWLGDKSKKVLGVDKKFEQAYKAVFPKRVIKEQILELEDKLIDMPYSRDLLLRLALLHYRIFEDDKAQKYFEQAKILDPNNKDVKAVEEVLGF